jgi:hypothetical protein
VHPGERGSAGEVPAASRLVRTAHAASPRGPPQPESEPPMRLSRPRSTRAGRAAFTAAACGSILILGTAAPAMADTHGQVLAVGDIPTVIGNLRTWLVGILATVATLFLTIGGVRYVISGGNPGEIEKAKSAFKAAAVGYALAVLAPVFMTILQSIVG